MAKKWSVSEVEYPKLEAALNELEANDWNVEHLMPHSTVCTIVSFKMDDGFEKIVQPPAPAPRGKRK